MFFKECLGFVVKGYCHAYVSCSACRYCNGLRSVDVYQIIQHIRRAVDVVLGFAAEASRIRGLGKYGCAEIIGELGVAEVIDGEVELEYSVCTAADLQLRTNTVLYREIRSRMYGAS